MILFLPLADFKTVQAPAPAAPSAPVPLAEIVGPIALLVLLLAASFLLAWLWGRSRRKPAASGLPDTWVLVDGSNVMHWQDSTPRLEPVQRVVERLVALGYVPGVVFDANAGWKLMGRYLHDGDFARLLAVEPRQVLVVPKGTQADPYLLETAREFGAKIVTNDRFRDWADRHPEVRTPGFLIRGGMREGEIRLEGIAKAGTAAT